MKQLQNLELQVKAIIAQNSELKENISLFAQENDAISAKLIALAQENAELSEKVAALEKTNAALSIRFDEAQTQALQGMDALTEREVVEKSIGQLLASIETAKLRDVA